MDMVKSAVLQKNLEVLKKRRSRRFERRLRML